MSPFFGKKKAEDALAHGEYERALEHIQKAGEFAGACQLRQEELVSLWDLNGRILDCLGRHEEALFLY